MQIWYVHSLYKRDYIFLLISFCHKYYLNEGYIMISFILSVCDKSSACKTGSSSTFTGVLFESVCLATEIERRSG